jgi:hypothetical protein
MLFKNKQMEPTTENYLNSLTEKERKAYEIAKSHLGSTFSLEKSNGYQKWKREPMVPLRPLPPSSDTNKSPCATK